MQAESPREFTLECHADSPRPAVRGLRARLSLEGDEMLRLSFLLEGHVARLRVPSLAAPLRADELWRHTCFEAFVRFGEGNAYYELNFAPSSQWAAYRFEGYRRGMVPVEPLSAPRIALRRSEYRLELDASLQLAELPGVGAARPVRIGLAAVIEAEDGTLSYWALKHSQGKPDFHRVAGCTARL